MGKSVPLVTLASAISVALLGAGMLGPAARAAELSAETAVIGQTSGSEVYIVTFAEPGLLDYQGNVSGLQATAPKAVGSRKLDVRSAASRAYDAYLENQRALHLSAIESTLGRPLEVTHSYSITLNGIAAQMSASEAAKIATVPGVQSVRPAGVEHLATYRGPAFIGADKIWDGSATPAGAAGATRGQGIVVGDLDGGINSDHPSFANDETCGFSAANPKLLSAVDCSTSSGGQCSGSNPEANTTFGHGVHTASTIVGNTIDNTANPAPLLPDGVKMSGVAPCASLRHYKVCQTNTCGGADILAGIQNAIADQVDVINFSISGGTSPWTDNDRQFLNALNADIFVAAAAGNTQEGDTTPVGKVNHRGPWVMTVAASTQDQIIGPQLTVTGPGTPPAATQHVIITPGSTTNAADTVDLAGLPIRTYPTNIAGCTDTGGFPPNYFAGSIALIRRGATPPSTTACTFTEKITNAKNAGAELVIIANNQVDSAGMDTTDSPPIPAFKVNDLPASDALIAFVNANLGTPANPDVVFADGFDGAPAGAGATADYDRAIQSARQGDVLADFSYRGPTPGNLADVTKPDISGPGVDIYAAWDDSLQYKFDSGTSMATPHVTGAGALIRSVHPDWTPTEVKSALMTTAINTNGVQEDGTTPWTIDQVGSGRVDLTKAALAGLTMDETYANFLAANPSGGSVDVKDLNIPSLRNMACSTTCTWTRTFKNRLSTQGTWNITASTPAGFTVAASPSTFTLAPGATQTVTFTATSNGSLSAITFGNVVLKEGNGQAPDQHLTVAIKGGTTNPQPGYCNGGVCNLQIDVLDTSFVGIGCAQYCGILWLNRFTPEPGEYPITLTKIQTIFGNGSGWNAAGDHINFYVYQDSDNDPSNGATLVGSYTGYTMPAPSNALATITLPTPIVVNGPGDLIIALTNPTGNVGLRPAAADAGPYADRSWLGSYTDTVAGAAPNLASPSIGLAKNPDAITNFSGNWIIRAQGTNGGGRPITLDPANE